MEKQVSVWYTETNLAFAGRTAEIFRGMRRSGKAGISMKKSDNIRWNRPIVTTGFMILLIVAASFGLSNNISSIEEEKCFERLYEEVAGLSADIEMHASNDREELKILSEIIASYDEMDSEKLWAFLDSYAAVGMMARVELLLPGDRVVVRGGKTVDAEGLLSFEEEAALGEHITDRERDILDSENYIVRHFVPITRDGETIAMLYGVIELGELPEEVNMDPYGGKGATYIIDGKTGDFLVDTWHPGEVGNMWELGEREMAPGYDSEQMKQGVADGDSRYVVFVSKTVGEYLYFYYEPMDINDWRIAVSVPESVVFESANKIKNILNWFLGFEVVLFILYFLWIIRYVKQTTDEKQRRLEMLNDIYDVENLLFNAHEKKENINAALEKIGAVIRAEEVGFWIVGQSYDNTAFFWQRQPRKEDERSAEWGYIGRLLEYFEAGNQEFESHEEKTIREMFGESVRDGIRSVTAVSVEDMDGKICGILEGRNIENKQDHKSSALLKNIKFSFSMFCQNLKLYLQIRNLGERDAMTGLYNRNRYEQDLLRIYSENQGPLACVYIDVNGLHEMNNTEGHEKGDKMLKTVAEEIRRYFPAEHSYRVGGDEFIIFVPGGDELEVMSSSEALVASLVRKDYHVSVGAQYESEVSSLADLIQAAEKKMYMEKKKYYEQETNDRRMRS